jgi:hypothetical protein
LPNGNGSRVTIATVAPALLTRTGAFHVALPVPYDFTGSPTSLKIVNSAAPSIETPSTTSEREPDERKKFFGVGIQSGIGADVQSVTMSPDESIRSSWYTVAGMLTCQSTGSVAAKDTRT